jgi:hypothetical protein
VKYLHTQYPAPPFDLSQHRPITDDRYKTAAQPRSRRMTTLAKCVIRTSVNLRVSYPQKSICCIFDFRDAHVNLRYNYICRLSPESPASRIHRKPHTRALSAAVATTRRGVRKKKLEIVQLWRCASCERIFTPGPVGLHNKTYAAHDLVSAQRLRARLHARRDGRSYEEEDRPARVAINYQCCTHGRTNDLGKMATPAFQPVEIASL